MDHRYDTILVTLLDSIKRNPFFSILYSSMKDEIEALALPVSQSKVTNMMGGRLVKHRRENHTTSRTSIAKKLF